MFRSKTVFVLGAGASNEAGLPLGSELKKIIARKLDLRFEHFSTPIGQGDMAIFQALRQLNGIDINHYLAGGWQIRDGVILSKSIDDYINTHQHDERIAICGKLAIAASIAEAEHSSKLFFKRERVDSTINFNELNETWYVRFFRLLTDGVLKLQIEEVFQNVSIISFNYDRCLEHFLLHALALHYAIPQEQARKLVLQLPIYRPYGSIGGYLYSASDTIGFGEKGIRSAANVIANIRTYTEIISEDEAVQIKSAIYNAETIVFLGSAFHENNMSILQSKKPSKVKRIFATRKGISESDLRVVGRQICRLRGVTFEGDKIPPYVLFAESCSDLFDYYSKSIATQPTSPQQET